MVRVPGIFLQSGEVIHPITGNNGTLDVGLYPTGSDDLARKVSEAFGKAGFAGGVNNFVMRTKAAKCLANLVNALQAITSSREGNEEFMAATRREAMEVWKAAGIEWEDYAEFQERIRSAGGTTVDLTDLPHISKPDSSWQSRMRGTGNIEAEQLNGDIVKLGSCWALRHLTMSFFGMWQMRWLRRGRNQANTQ